MFTRTQNRFRPALDALEARDCLSGMSLLGGHTLLITGDSHANHVVIRQDDAANSLVVVVDDMAQAFRSDQVSTGPHRPPRRRRLAVVPAHQPDLPPRQDDFRRPGPG